LYFCPKGIGFIGNEMKKDYEKDENNEMNESFSFISLFSSFS